MRYLLILAVHMDIPKTIATPMGMCFNKDKNQNYKWVAMWQDMDINWGPEDSVICKPVCQYLGHVLAHKAHCEEAPDQVIYLILA